MTTPTADALSARDRATWTLWADWCAAVDKPALPAAPTVLARFIAANPAKPRTQRRRVAIINSVHRRGGHRPPGIAETVREAIDTARADRRRQLTTIAADVITTTAPEGWPANLFGRRDALLLVLATSGIGPTALARTTIGQLYVNDTTDQLHVHTGDGQDYATDPALPDLGVSPAAVLDAWLPLRALQHHIPSARITAIALRGDATPPVPAPPDHTPLFTPLDSWGTPPLNTTTPLSAGAISAVLRAHLTGGTAAHRHIASRPDPEPQSEPTEYPTPAPLDPEAWDRGLAARRAAQSTLADVDHVLDDVDTQAGQLLEELLQLLDDATNPVTSSPAHVSPPRPVEG